MWYDEATFYHIYPLGLCGAPEVNDGVCVDRISKLTGWIDHLKELNIGAVYFSPVFESDNHGYDTRDYTKIDCRLGTNEDFAKLCEKFHDAGIRVVLDGVFNHVGRGFWAFEDVKKNRENSRYKDWFCINFGGNSNYNDGFWYEGWEGHFELVKLNLHNNEVVEHIFSCIKGWVDEFKIDGLRLDVAYSLEESFLKSLRKFCKELDPDFFLIGEMIHGDYNRIVNSEMLDSATNYECYKGLYSSFNSMNMFEIAHSLNRQFGPEGWTLYKGKNLMCFADNHDVTRIYSILEEKEHIFPLYAVLFAMPGIPCIYYGSEWGAKGEKSQGDSALRPAFEKPVENEISDFVSRLAKAKSQSKALSCGNFKNETIKNKQWVFTRETDDEKVLVAVNAEDAPAEIECKFSGKAENLLTGKKEEINLKIKLEAFEAKYLVQNN